MAKLNIYVTVLDNATISTFGKMKDKEKITFHNQHPTDTLVVSVQGEAGIPLCKGNNAVPGFEVTALKKKESFTICDNYQGDSFKYSASIGNFAEEDPIIIIERGKLLSGSVPILAAVSLAVVAFVLGAAIATYMRQRKAQTHA